MKQILLNLMILLNTAYFGFTLSLTYSWDGFSYTKGANGNRWYELQNSALLEEFGYISYIVALVLSVTCIVMKISLKRLWSFIAVLPVATVLLLYFVF